MTTSQVKGGVPRTPDEWAMLQNLQEALPVAITFPNVAVLCMVIITTVLVTFFLNWLQPVLVPLIMGAFLAQLFEPVLEVIVRAPGRIAWFARRFNPCSPSPSHATDSGPTSVLDHERSENLLLTEATLGAEIIERRSAAEASQGWPRTTPGRQQTLTEADSHTPPSSVAQPRRCTRRLGDVIKEAWEYLAVFLCSMVACSILVGIVSIAVASFQHTDFTKYVNSPKIQRILKYLATFGVKNLSPQSLYDMFKGQIFDWLSGAMAGVEQLGITLIMFFFCLVAFLPGVRARGQKRHVRVKSLVHQYILYKTISSVTVGILVAFSLGLMQVDLWQVYGLLTVLFNYIPNVGTVFAIAAPVPLVALDPESDLQKVIWVIVVPFIIHNTAGCMIETKLMSQGLDLHPLTVVVSLIFWGMVWGPVGTVVSVPMVSVCRLWLEEVEHPLAAQIVHILNGPGSKRRSSFVYPSSSSRVARGGSAGSEVCSVEASPRAEA